MPISQFDADTTPTKTAPATWTARLSDRWNIGDNSNGGYLVAVVLKALAELSENPHPISVTTHFLRPGIGETDSLIRGEVVKHGRAMTSLRGSLEQNGKTRVEVLAGFGELDVGPAERELSYPPPVIPDPDDCVSRIHLEQGVELPILDRVDVRIHPDHATAGRSPEAKVSGWVRLSDGTEPDAMVLAMFADAFPPSLFALYGYIGWVPTLELTVHIRRNPAPGWILATFESDDLNNGRFIETGSLWDSSGALVARSRQLAILRTDEESKNG